MSRPRAPFVLLREGATLARSLSSHKPPTTPVRTGAYGCDTEHPVAPPSSRSEPKAIASDDRLLELIGDTEGLLEIDEFRHGLLGALHRAVPADWVSLNDIGPDPNTIVAIVEPPLSAGQRERFARYAHQNPLIAVPLP